MARVLRYALKVLSADPSASARARAESASWSVALIVGAVLLVIYGLVVGIALLSGSIAPGAAYAWMVPVPLALVIWHVWGWTREPQSSARDAGLLVSAGGWLSVAFCLLALHGAARAALNAGLRLDQMTASPLSWLFAALAIVGLAIGAFLSWQHWQRQT